VNRAPVSSTDPKALFLRCAEEIENKYKLLYVINIYNIVMLCVTFYSECCIRVHDYK
jgi:hypothetical protein